MKSQLELILESLIRERSSCIKRYRDLMRVIYSSGCDEFEKRCARSECDNLYSIYDDLNKRILELSNEINRGNYGLH